MAYAATIGFFDGVHMGHRFVLSTLRNISQKTGLDAAVITFSEHPQKVLHGKTVPLLTTYDERMSLLKEAGVDEIFAFNFDIVKDFSAEDFMRVLHSQCGVEILLMGYDHHFGADGLRSFDDYQASADRVGLQLMKISQSNLEDNNLVPSSTAIRQALQEGRVEDANALLGYAYSLTGEVVEGRQLGRQLGFPTANLALPQEKLLPTFGVYACKVQGQDDRERVAILNVGANPTVGGQDVSVEVHIPDFEGDLYGKQLTVKLYHYLRPEQRFDSLTQLRLQIEKDLVSTLNLLNGF